MPDREDEFQRLLGETGVADHVDDFDRLANELGVHPQEEATEVAPAHAEGTGSGWLDALLGGEEGLTLGNTHNLGKLGAGLATRVSDALSPSLERDGMAPEYAGPRGDADWLSELTGRAQETLPGKLGRGAGTLVTALGTGGVAGPGVAQQAAAGAALGGAQAAGESDGDWLAMLAGMGGGAALGGAGGLVGSGGNAIARNADDILSQVPKPGIAQMITSPVRSALAMGGRAAASSPGIMNGLASTARGAGAVGAAGGGAAAGLVAPAMKPLLSGTAHAQDGGVAYGTAPTMAWAVQSVLASGDSGLPPEDEQRLTEALLDGDDDKVISANFALQMKRPAYAARLQRELQSLQQEE